MMGLNKANATYACVWCTVAKEERCTVYKHFYAVY
jgi:hypothetical protein